jgi:hypothetical protein
MVMKWVCIPTQERGNEKNRGSKYLVPTLLRGNAYGIAHVGWVALCLTQQHSGKAINETDMES